MLIQFKLISIRFACMSRYQNRMRLDAPALRNKRRDIVLWCLQWLNCNQETTASIDPWCHRWLSSIVRMQSSSSLTIIIRRQYLSWIFHFKNKINATRRGRIQILELFASTPLSLPFAIITCLHPKSRSLNKMKLQIWASSASLTWMECGINQEEVCQYLQIQAFWMFRTSKIQKPWSLSLRRPCWTTSRAKSRFRNIHSIYSSLKPILANR